jgi:polyisoprenoid-binding protein YceI
METAVATKTTWAIDPTHTEVQFKVKHLVIATVTGAFKKFSGSVEAEGDSFDGAKTEFSIDVTSIDTNQNDRDAHLKSEDFFAAASYPQITFKNGKLVQKGEAYDLVGDLTIRDITKRVTLKAEYGGTVTDPWGNVKAGFEINGKISRTEFGLKWNAVTEAGGVVVGDEVKLHLNVELARG